jgi:hypothetical protein
VRGGDAPRALRLAPAVALTMTSPCAVIIYVIPAAYSTSVAKASTLNTFLGQIIICNQSERGREAEREIVRECVCMCLCA